VCWILTEIPATAYTPREKPLGLGLIEHTMLRDSDLVIYSQHFVTMSLQVYYFKGLIVIMIVKLVLKQV